MINASFSNASDKNSTVFFYYPPLYLETSVTVICLFSVVINWLVWFVVRKLRENQNASCSFLNSISLLIGVEIVICVVRSVHGILCIIALLTDTIDLKHSWFDMPDMILWATNALLQFIRNWWLMCITFFRMLLVCFPLRNFLALSNTLIRRAHLSVWLFSTVLPLSMLSQIMSNGTINFGGENTGLVITMFTLSNASPSILILVMSTSIVLTLRKSNVNIANVNTQDNYRKNNKRATRTVLLIALSFLILQLPIFAMSITFMISSNKKNLGDLLYLALNLSFVDTLSNCAVLFYSNQVFRTTFCNFVRRIDAGTSPRQKYFGARKSSTTSSTKVTQVNSDKNNMADYTELQPQV